MDQTRRILENKAAFTQQFSSLDENWQQAIAQVHVIHAEMGQRLIEALLAAGTLINHGVLPSRNSQQKKDSFDDTIGNWVQEFLYHLNGYRIATRHSLEDLKHIFEDHKVNKLYVEQANDVLENYPQKLLLPKTNKEFIEEQSCLLSILGKHAHIFEANSRRGMLNLDPQPHSRTRGMQKTEICQLYKTHYGYLSPRVKNPMFFGETQMEEMKKKVLKLEGELATQTLTVTSLRKEYQAIEQRLASTKGSFEQQQHKFEAENHHLREQNSLLQEQILSLQSSIATMQQASFQPPLQTKETLRSRLTTRSSFRGAYSQPPRRITTLDDVKDESENDHYARDNFVRRRDYTDIIPSEADKSYHSSRDNLSATLKQVHALREMVIKERKVREELEKRLMDRELSESSQRTGNFNARLEIEEKAADSLHKTRLEYEEKLFRLNAEKTSIRTELENELLNLKNTLQTQKNLSSILQDKLDSSQRLSQDQIATIQVLQADLNSTNEQLYKCELELKAALASAMQPQSAMHPSSPTPPRSPISRLERSGSSYSPLQKGPGALLDMSMHDPIFKTGTCENCEGGSARSRKLYTDSKKDQEISELREKILQKRNEITLMQERELNQQRAFHSEMQLLQEAWARERSELQMKLSLLQQDQKRLEDNLQLANTKITEQSAAAGTLNMMTAKVRLLENSLQSVQNELQSQQLENTQLRLSQQNHQSRVTEVEKLAQDYAAANQRLQSELHQQSQEFKLLFEREKFEIQSQSKGIASKVTQLELLLQESDQKLIVTEQKIRELRGSLESSQDMNNTLLKRVEYLKENTRFALIKAIDKYRREIYTITSQHTHSVFSKIKILEERVLGINTKTLLLKRSGLLSIVSTQQNDLKVAKLEAALVAERTKLASLQIQSSHEQQEAVNQIQKLRDELAKQTEYNKNKLSEQQSENSRLSKELQTQKDWELDSLRAEIESLRSLSAREKRQLESANAIIAELEAKNVRLKESNESQVSLNSELKIQHTRNLREMEVKSLEDSRTRDESIKDLQRQLDQTRQSLESELTKNRELAVLREKISELSSQKKSLESNIQQAQLDFQTQQAAQSERHTAALAILESRLASTESTLQHQQRAAADLGRTLQEAAAREETLRERLQAERTDRERLRAEGETREALWVQQRRTLEERESRAARLREEEGEQAAARVQAVREELEKAEAAARRERAAAEELQGRLRVAVAKGEELEAALRTLQIEAVGQATVLQAAKTEVLGLEQRLEENQKAFSNKEEAYKNQIENCKLQIVQQEAAFKKKQEEIEKEAMNTSQARLEVLKLEMQAQNTLELAKKDAAIYQIQHQNSELDRQLLKAKAELVDATQSLRDLEIRLIAQIKSLQEQNSLLTKSLEDTKIEFLSANKLNEENIKALKAEYLAQREIELNALSDRYLKEKNELVAKAVADLEHAKLASQKESDALLQGLRSDYEAKLTQAISAQENLKAELEVARLSMSEGEQVLKASLSEALKTASDLESEIKKLRTSEQTLETHKTELASSLAEAQQAYENSKKSVSDLEAEIMISKQKASELEAEKQGLASELRLFTHKSVAHRQVQTEVEVCDAKEAQTQVQRLEALLVVEKTAIQEQKEKFAVDKSKLLEKLAWLEKELARQKDQIMDKLTDIKSLRQSRELELAHFKISVEEFNKQLEDERRVFNQQLRELDEQKRLQFEMLNKKVRELELQRDKERELYSSMQNEQTEQSLIQQELEDYQKKDSAIKEMIEQYKRELERLKAENTDLKSENLEAMKSIREFLSRIDPDESPEQLKGFKIDEALEKLSQRMGNTPTKGVNLVPKVAFVRTQSVMNVNVDDNMNDSMDSGYKRPSTMNEFLGVGKDMARSKGMMSATTSPITKRRGMQNTKVVEAAEESDNDSTPENKPESGLQVTERKFVLEIEPVKTESVGPPRITVHEPVSKSDFKLGRSLSDLPLPNRQFKPKLAEIVTSKEARSRIKQQAHVTPIMLPRGRLLSHRRSRAIFYH